MVFHVTQVSYDACLQLVFVCVASRIAASRMNSQKLGLYLYFIELLRVSVSKLHFQIIRLDEGQLKKQLKIKRPTIFATTVWAELCSDACI